ncbi:uncharacterized protein IUM83_15072, partial [Phytophthora cinnamomi]|uniref:uncharacterized protein n=1 Tax=Phytophthora cinnamomi TaxID=4785 RepID=UPI0035593B7C
MIDEDSISVVITASKEVEGGETLDADDGGVVTHAGKGHKYTMYTVFVRNVTTGGKCVVRRRYSDFYKRKELMELVLGPLQLLRTVPAADRRVPVPAPKAAALEPRGRREGAHGQPGLFLRHMLCIMARSFEDCSQACENIENCILKSFLQMEHRDA